MAEMQIEFHDPRTSDLAELAHLVACELRKTHGIRTMRSGKHGVHIGPYYYDTACKGDWSVLGPIAIAIAIKEPEAVRAAFNAGDL
jgi:hypothetical protein